MRSPALAAHTARGSGLGEAHLVTHVPAQDRVPVLEKFAFSAGTCTEYLATGLTTGVLWMPYFNIGLGMSPLLVGAVLMVLRAWEAFADPFLGNLSDNAQTPWGRRRPFIILGAILTAAIFPLFWHMPTGCSEHAKAAYLIVVGVLFFTSFATWGMPYYGLQMELTSNYDERTRLSSFMAFFSKLSSLAGGWVLALVTGGWLVHAADGKGNIVAGMKTGCWFISAAILISGICPALFVRERPGVAMLVKCRDPFWNSLKESSRCTPLWALIGISFCLLIGSTATGTLGQYLSIYYVFGGDIHAASVVGGWKNTVIVAVGILSIPLWAWLGERLDKKIMVIALLAMGIAGIELNALCLRPDMPYLQIVPGILESGAYGALWLFLPSMKADVADWDEMHTGRRREGALNAFYSWFVKAALTCGVGVGALVLEFTGYHASWPSQPPEVLHRMVTIYLLMPAATFGVAIFIACWYPLNRESMARIREKLEAARGIR